MRNFVCYAGKKFSFHQKSPQNQSGCRAGAAWKNVRFVVLTQQNNLISNSENCPARLSQACLRGIFKVSPITSLILQRFFFLWRKIKHFSKRLFREILLTKIQIQKKKKKKKKKKEKKEKKKKKEKKEKKKEKKKRKIKKKKEKTVGEIRALWSAVLISACYVTEAPRTMIVWFSESTFLFSRWLDERSSRFIESPDGGYRLRRCASSKKRQKLSFFIWRPTGSPFFDVFRVFLLHWFFN